MLQLKRAYEPPARTDGRRILVDLVREIARQAARGPVTLVYGVRDEEHNDAVVLAAAVRSCKK